MSVANIYKKIELVGLAPDPKPGEPLEKSAKGKAMLDAIAEAVAHPSLKDSNLASLPLGKAYSYLFEVLPTLRDTDFKIASPIHINPKSGDFYERLGVPRNATSEDIETAYQNWVSLNNPDVLKASGISPEEIQMARDEMTLITTSYHTLSNPELRKDYDKFWGKDFAGKSSDKGIETGNVPKPTDDEGSDFSYIAAGFTPSTAHKNEGAINKTMDFRKTVTESGAFVVDDNTVEYLDKRGLIPEGFNKNQITNAFQLYSRGATSEGLVAAIGDLDSLGEAERTSLGNTAFFMSFYEEAGLEDMPSQGDLFEAGGQPTFALSQKQSASPSSATHISFDRKSDNILSPMLNKVGDIATDKVQDLATKGLKAGAKNILKKGVEETAVKAGAKLAGNAGLKAAVWAVLEGFGLPAGPLGEAIASAIAFVLTELLPLVVNFVKKFVDLKTLAYTLMALGGLMMGAGAGLVGGATLGMGGYSYFKARGGGSLTRGIGGAFSSFGAAAGIALAAVVVSMGWPIFIALVVIPIMVASALFIINSGAYVVPPFPPNTGGSIVVSNPYMDVAKTLKSLDPSKCQDSENTPTHIKCLNSELAFEIEYSVTISAKRGSLTDVQINDVCKVEREASGSSGCPPATNIQIGNGIGPSSFPFSPPGNTISPTETFEFTYKRKFDPPLTYYDSLVYDTITVTATSSDNTSEKVSSSASVCIGNCPQSCPTIWPVESGYVTQGPDGNYSHNAVEAIDISRGPGNTSGAAVFATHGGTVRLLNDSCEGNVVMIEATCGGITFNSRYSHLGSRNVQNGATVVKGQQIGTIDNSGTCTGSAHLHYEFRDGEGRSSRAFRMEPPNIPESILPNRSCCNNCGTSCTTDIP